MKMHEIKEMKNEELIEKIKEEERNLVDLRFTHQLKQLTNTSKINLVKKDIARMKTILHERELEAKTDDAIAPKEGDTE